MEGFRDWKDPQGYNENVDLKRNFDRPVLPNRVTVDSAGTVSFSRADDPETWAPADLSNPINRLLGYGLPPMAEQRYVIAQRMHNHFLRAALDAAHRGHGYVIAGAPRSYRPRKRKHNLQPRVDLPVFDRADWGKPWPPRDRSEVIADMQAARRRPCNIDLARLVPEEVRLASAERWRLEQQELREQECAAAELAKPDAVINVEVPSRLRRFGYWVLGWHLQSDTEIIQRAIDRAELRSIGNPPTTDIRDCYVVPETDVEPPTTARRIGWAEPKEDPRAFAFDPRTAHALVVNDNGSCRDAIGPLWTVRAVGADEPDTRSLA